MTLLDDILCLFKRTAVNEKESKKQKDDGNDMVMVTPHGKIKVTQERTIELLHTHKKVYVVI